MSYNSSAGGDFGIGMVLFIVFLILKLTHTIDWRWIWVCSPLWIFAGFVIFVLLALGVIAAISRM